MKIQLTNDWKELLRDELEQPYFLELREKLTREIESGIQIFPYPQYIFEAFNQCSLSNTKVVILGQDPYHSLSPIQEPLPSPKGRGTSMIPHAHGMSFSIPRESTKIPPSLKNIYKELAADLGHTIPSHGNLQSWAEQGVLLLNASLTVQAHQANSHKNYGWHTFTDHVIEKISNHKEHVVFICWGAFAQGKIPLIDETKHLIIKSPHPSPFSAHNGFFGSKPFSKTNSWLKKQELPEIAWEVK